MIKIQIFHHAKILPNLQNNPLKNKPKSFKILLLLLQLDNKSQVSTQAKIIIFQKSSSQKIDLLPRGQNPLSYYTL